MGSDSVVQLENRSDKLFITSVSLRDTCSLISDLRLGDLNYLLSVKPTLQRQGRDGLPLITKQTLTLLNNGRLKSTHRQASQITKTTQYIR
jgi:hypothetical protein